MENLKNYYAGLTSEQVNPATMDIDIASTEEIIAMINREDALVADAVKKETANIAKAVDVIVQGLKNGGSIIYVGAGTSGRLGVLDASECPPTYGTPPQLVQSYIAGGDGAIRTAVEGAEDDKNAGMQLINNCSAGKNDIVVGITASGSAPYVLGALEQARQNGAATVGVVTNSGTLVHKAADICIAPIVGPEVIMGSTRMKSGTAQKMVLNMLTTASMVKLGKVYHNMMVDLNVSNKKLSDRALRIIKSLTGANDDTALQALNNASGSVKLAVFMIKTGKTAAEGTKYIAESGGHLRAAIQTAEVE